MKALSIVIVCIFFAVYVKAQEVTFTQPVQSAPTKEIYDLLVDRKGFLWTATSLGLYRYDGIQFIKFSNPRQTSVSILSVLEDDQGRIWYNNYAGQIFYIYNETVHLLDAYAYQKETSFPRMVIFEHKLVATSAQGLFVLNTATMKGGYIKCIGKPALGTRSLAVTSKALVVHTGKEWLIYRGATGLRQAKIKSATLMAPDNASLLSGVSYRDTVFQISNPEALITKVLVTGDSLTEIGTKKLTSFVNTIITDKNNLWINTISASYRSGSAEVIRDESLTDIVTDHEGNTWYASSKRGLSVNYRKTSAINIDIPLLNDDSQVDNVFSRLARYDNQLLAGTANGTLVLYDPASKEITRKFTLPGNIGSVVNIYALNHDEFMIGCSVNTYRLNVATGQVLELNIKALKNLVLLDEGIVGAATSGLFVIPRLSAAETKAALQKQFGNVFRYDSVHNVFFIIKRCNAVCYYAPTRSLLVNFKDGVFSINRSGIKPLRYNNNNIFVTSLSSIGDVAFMGLIQGGLLTMSPGGFSSYLNKEGVSSNIIFKMKQINDHLWLNGSGALQLFDLKQNKVSTQYDLPSQNEKLISDVEEINGQLYFATFEGLMRLSLKSKTQRHVLENYLLSVKINDALIDSTHHVFPNQSKSVQFNLGVPLYSSAADVSIKYALITSGDTLWHMSEVGQRNFSYSYLSPGNYTFKAIAFNPYYGTAQQAISYSFSITPPWWQQLWFKVGVFLFILCVVIYILATYDLRKLTFKRALQKQAESIKTERNRISSEIHDDIGSSLFAIQLFADVASKRRTDIEEIGQISQKINEMSDKIREIIWSTNVGNDNLENLIYYIQAQATRMFEHSVMDFDVTMSDWMPDMTVDAVDRKNIYLIVKEFVHNAIKHSQGTKVVLDIVINPTEVIFVIKDNGIGFDINILKMNSMGMHNVKNRIVQLHGTLTIETDGGTVVTVKVPLVRDENLPKSKWRLPFMS